MNQIATIANWYGPAERKAHDPIRPQPFTSVCTSVLVEILSGELDPMDAAAFELNARCRDHSGNFVGMKESGLIYERYSGRKA